MTGAATVREPTALRHQTARIDVSNAMPAAGTGVEGAGVHRSKCYTVRTCRAATESAGMHWSKGRCAPEAIGHNHGSATRARCTPSRGVDWMLIAARDLPKILFLKESVRLHLIENPAPAFAALEIGDLISAQARTADGRLRLRRKKGVGDLLVARREALKSAGAGATAGHRCFRCRLSPNRGRQE